MFIIIIIGFTYMVSKNRLQQKFDCSSYLSIYYISETRYFERVLNRIIHLKTTKFSFKTTNQAMQKFDSSRYTHTDKLMYVVRTWTCSTFSVTCLDSHSNFFASNSKTTRQSSTVRMNHCCRLHHFTKNHYTE